jgi:hypothetical protein
MLDGFETAEVDTGETNIFLRWSDSGSPLLLLHGFPQTHLMWRGVAPLLARRFTVVCADLRGYGRSGCPASTPDHSPYAKRAMARDMVAVMEHVGFLASRLPGMTVAVVSPIAWRSTIRIGSSDWPSSIFSRQVKSGSEPTHGSRLPTGPGRCSPNPNRCPSASSRRCLKPSSRMHLPAGARDR